MQQKNERKIKERKKYENNKSCQTTTTSTNMVHMNGRKTEVISKSNCISFRDKNKGNQNMRSKQKEEEEKEE